jgi:hypothetical protein
MDTRHTFNLKCWNCIDKKSQSLTKFVNKRDKSMTPHICILSYDAGSRDASEYHADGIEKVQHPKVKLYILLNANN